jgi:hypothetical protein
MLVAFPGLKGDIPFDKLRAGSGAPGDEKEMQVPFDYAQGRLSTPLKYA